MPNYERMFAFVDWMYKYQDQLQPIQFCKVLDEIFTEYQAAVEHERRRRLFLKRTDTNKRQ